MCPIPIYCTSSVYHHYQSTSYVLYDNRYNLNSADKQQSDAPINHNYKDNHHLWWLLQSPENDARQVSILYKNVYPYNNKFPTRVSATTAMKWEEVEISNHPQPQYYAIGFHCLLHYTLYSQSNIINAFPISSKRNYNFMVCIPDISNPFSQQWRILSSNRRRFISKGPCNATFTAWRQAPIRTLSL